MRAAEALVKDLKAKSGSRERERLGVCHCAVRGPALLQPELPLLTPQQPWRKPPLQ